MELTERDIGGLRLLANHGCQQDGEMHHRWLHERLNSLVRDHDQLMRITRICLPYAPLSAFGEEEAAVVGLQPRRTRAV